MKTRKRKARPQYMDYPKAKAYRGGCKVAWNYYETEADAKICAEAAEHNAKLQAAEGYDFGYCAPGSITLRTDEGEFKGLYEVCLP